MKKYYVYLAGPMTGHSNEYCGWRYREFEAYRRGDIIPVDPMRGKKFLEGATIIEDSYSEHMLGTPKFIIERDYNDVKNCDVVFMNLLGAKRISIGSMIELGWAMAHGKPIILIMEPDNLHEHPMVLEAFHAHVAPSILTGVAMLNNLLLPKEELESIDAERDE
jgi:nucleoside 2-deoxyribosyltransferase